MTNEDKILAAIVALQTEVVSLKTEVTSFKNDMDARFNQVDERLGNVEQNLSDLTEQVKENTTLISALIEGQTKMQIQMEEGFDCFHRRVGALEVRLSIDEAVTRQNSYEIMYLRGDARSRNMYQKEA